MKKNLAEFPWYLIYTPVIAIVLIVWRLSTVLGDGLMSYVKDVLQWLGLDDVTTTNIFMIVLVVAAVFFVITKWISTNKRLKVIEGVAKDAPGELDNRIGKESEKICGKIDGTKDFYTKEITEIKCSTSAVQRQIENISQYRQDVPMQQGRMIAEISNLYSVHDKDQETISEQRLKISQLEEANAKLERRLRETERELQEYRGGNSNADYEWEP